MRFIKKLAFLGALAYMAGIFAGCSSSQQQVSTSAGGAAQGVASATANSPSGSDGSRESATLRCFWYGGEARHQATLAAIDEYMAQNQNIAIEPEYMVFDGYGEKLFTQLASNNAPDVFQFSADWLNDVMVQGEPLLPLSGRPDIDLGQFPQSMLDMCVTYNGKVYAAPSSAVGYACIVNMAFFAERDLAVPDQWTWDDFIDLGRQVHEADPDAYLTTADIDVINRLLFGSSIVQVSSGKQFVDADYKLQMTEEELAKSLQLIADLYTSGTVEPFNESTVFVGKMEQNPKFILNQIGVIFDITNSYSKYKLENNELQTVPLPVHEGAANGGYDYSGSPGWAISSKSASVDESCRFMNWLVNDPKAAAILGDARGVPASKSSFDAFKAAGKMDDNLERAINLSMDNGYTINLYSKNSELYQIRKDVLEKVIYSEITPQQGAGEIIEKYASKQAELAG
jgi:oligogalacturonide transport system substrate-binding protein